MTHAVMKHLRLMLVLLLLLLLLLLEGASCISHRTEAAWGPAAAVLIIALKLLQSPAAAAAVLIIARKLLQSPTAAAVLIIARKLLLLLRKNFYVFGNVIVPRGIILLTLKLLIERFD